jgi:hypothetical protein
MHKQGRVIKYGHHKTRNSVRKNLKGKHKEYNLCWSCDYFHPQTKMNCEISQDHYKFCIKNNVVSPVFECPKFKHTHRRIAYGR